MSVRRGGKVCWGGSGAIPTIPTYVELQHFIPAERFIGPGGAYSAAQTIWDEQTSGFIGQVVKMPTALTSTSTAYDVHRGVVYYPVPTATWICEIHGYCDNASTANMSFNLGYWKGSEPGSKVDQAPTFIGIKTVPANGQFNLMRITFQVPNVGNADVWGWWIQRMAADPTDLNPGNFMSIGLLVYGFGELV